VRKLLVRAVVASLLVAMAVMSLSLLPMPKYEATARVLVDEREQSGESPISGHIQPLPNPRTSFELIEAPIRLAASIDSRPVAKEAIRRLERVMNSIRKGLGIGEREIGREPSRPCNPHFYAVFAQVHNTL
jgi:uncharacterized protein involved in exopolysaccharide biosynthesis